MEVKLIPRKTKRSKKVAKKGKKRAYRTGPGQKRYTYGLNKKGKLTYLGRAK